MKDYLSENRKWWNNVTPVHFRSKLYNLANFKKEKNSLFSVEREELGSVHGRTLLHLMCHFGMDTLSLAHLGAKATGVDLSDDSIKLAKKLSREIKVPATFIRSDIFNLPEVLDKKFDIIFTSYGVLCWISNIKKWAKIINHFLSDGGMFYMVELHPFTNILTYDFKIEFDYFDKGPFVDDSTGTYSDWKADIKGDTYLWSYTIADIVNALIAEGMKIEYIHEFPYTNYDQFPGFMEQNEKRQYILKNKKIQIPLLFSLKAVK